MSQRPVSPATPPSPESIASASGRPASIPRRTKFGPDPPPGKCARLLVHGLCGGDNCWCDLEHYEKGATCPLTLSRCVLPAALVCLLAAAVPRLAAQQFQPGVVLDPVQPGNIAEIFGASARRRRPLPQLLQPSALAPSRSGCRGTSVPNASSRPRTMPKRPTIGGSWTGRRSAKRHPSAAAGTSGIRRGQFRRGCRRRSRWACCSCLASNGGWS